MGVLGYNAIQNALGDGSIYCFPEPNESQLQLASLDVTLGPNFWFPMSYGIPEIDTSSTDPKEYYCLYSFEDVVILPPKEKILGHTNESVGTTVSNLVPSLQCRSTAARWGIQIAACAGWGDPGFCGRWTLEITNTLEIPIKIKIGARIGQVLFYTVENPKLELYNNQYNQSHEDWHPDHMLPKPLL